MSILKENSIYSFNKRIKSDGLDLLANINNESIDAVFFDPQYRGVLDKLKYGNEGNREKARCDLPQMDIITILKFILEIDRVLKKSRYLFLWIDKFHLCDGVKEWLNGTSLNIVDMIVWDKGRIGMGYRTRRKSEYLMIIQKCPIRAKDFWKDHSIPDVWQEKIMKTHPHSKPVDLQKRLILATTNEGDVVLDPASGGYSVLEACKAINRNFLGCDVLFGEK